MAFGKSCIALHRRPQGFAHYMCPKAEASAVNRDQQCLKAQGINGMPGLAQVWLHLGQARDTQGTYAVDVEQVRYPC